MWLQFYADHNSNSIVLSPLRGSEAILVTLIFSTEQENSWLLWQLCVVFHILSYTDSLASNDWNLTEDDGCYNV